MSMLSANASQTQTLAAIIAQQGKTIEGLARKVSELESAHKWELKTENVSLGKTEKVTILGKVKDFVKDTCVDVSDTSTDLNVGIGGNSCKRKLEFVNFSSHDIDILYMIKQRHAGSPFAFLSHNRSEMTSEETSTCLDLSFRPPPGMQFFGTELAVAAYIFSNHGEEREHLYDDPHCDGLRFRFLSLRPGCELYDDVLNMVVGMCTGKKKDKTKWWPPTTFSHMFLNPDQFSQDTMDYIKDRYMGKADDLMMIYIPMHTKNHWYLMIVDIWDKTLVYLDFFHSLETEETQFRISQIRHVANYLEKMISDRSFWESKDAFPPLVSTFEPSLPPTGQQEYGSMDCGVWVCEWMMNSHLWLDYRLEDVNDSSRMAIAVQLVTSRENPLCEVISDHAINYWDAKMLRNHRRERNSDSLSGGIVLEEDPPQLGSPTI